MKSPALPLAVLVLGHGALVLAGPHGQLPVTAEVVPVARVESLASPATFTVTSDDLQRGYVNVLEPVHLRVLSNSRAGYQIDVHNLAPRLTGLVVAGAGEEARLPAEGGTLVQRWQAPHTDSLALRFRLDLPADLAPGTYPWPVRLAVRPL